MSESDARGVLPSRRQFLSSLAVGGAAIGCARPRATTPGVTLSEVAAVDRFAALAGFCDGVSAVTPQEYHAHRETARGLAADQGISALVFEAGTSMNYFTGARWGTSERPLIYVLPTSGEPFWVGPAFEEGSLREAFIGDEALVTWREHGNPYDHVAGALKSRSIDAGAVAADPAMRLFVASGLRTSGVELTSGAAVIDGCRMIKTEPELKRMRRANEATKRALREVANHTAPGMDEAAVTALVKDAQTAAGLTNIWALVAFGENAAYPHGSGKSRALAKDDLILVDTGGSLHGYRSDITRTWPVGAPSAAAKDVWETVLAAQSAAMEAIRPGARCADIDAAARAVIAERGHGENYERFTHRLGHGIGLQVHEEPYLVRDSERVLVAGMTMSNEPGIYIPGSVGVRIEDIVAVTTTGYEVFGPTAASFDRPFGPQT